MAIHLSDHFTYGRLLRFTLPSVAMTLFTSIYSVVDGFFVANFAGTTALAAVSLAFPLLGILSSAGFMLGAGGAAAVGAMLGEGRGREARQAFSLAVYATLGLGLLLSLLGQIFIEPCIVLFGASGEVLAQSVAYGRISLLSLPCFMLQFCFQPFFVTAERPRLGLAVTVGAGCTNICLDALLVMGLGWGLEGAAWATVASETLGGLLPVLYFAGPNRSLLALARPLRSWRFLGRACANGASELLINLAYPLLMALYNWRLLRLAGEHGVAAFGALMYVSYFFVSVFLGYALGSAPLASYSFGARAWGELAGVFRKSLVLNGLAGIGLAGTALVCAGPLAGLFTGHDPALCAMTARALALFSPKFLICWVNIYGSSFFTALNNGLASGAIALLRTLIFGVLCVLVLPELLGLDGVWLAWPCAELLTAFASCSLLARRRREEGARP